MDAVSLENWLVDDVVGRVACAGAGASEVGVCDVLAAGRAREELESAVTGSVQVEPEMVDSRGDDGSGVFSEEERRAWRHFHEVEMRGVMGSDADAGWQLMRSRRCCRAHGISSRLPVGRAFDAVQDVRLVDCTSRLGRASN